MNPVVLALATQRLTQLITEDEIARPAREAVTQWAAPHPEYSVPERVSTLIGCPACVSIWAAAGVLLASRVAPGRVLVRILAASGASLIIAEGLRKLER